MWLNKKEIQSPGKVLDVSGFIYFGMGRMAGRITR